MYDPSKTTIIAATVVNVNTRCTISVRVIAHDIGNGVIFLQGALGTQGSFYWKTNQA
jgi:hypothetical protein